MKHLAQIPRASNSIRVDELFVLPQLETLEIHRQNDTLLLLSLLRHVRAPRLRRIAISFNQSNSFVGSLDDYLERQRPTLLLFVRHFHLHSQYASDQFSLLLS